MSESVHLFWWSVNLVFHKTQRKKLFPTPPQETQADKW